MSGRLWAVSVDCRRTQNCSKSTVHYLGQWEELKLMNLTHVSKVSVKAKPSRCKNSKMHQIIQKYDKCMSAVLSLARNLETLYN